jgi:hypothetical protein
MEKKNPRYVIIVDIDLISNKALVKELREFNFTYVNFLVSHKKTLISFRGTKKDIKYLLKHTSFKIKKKDIYEYANNSD